MLTDEGQKTKLPCTHVRAPVKHRHAACKQKSKKPNRTNEAILQLEVSRKIRRLFHRFVPRTGQKKKLWIGKKRNNKAGDTYYESWLYYIVDVVERKQKTRMKIVYF